MKNLNPYIGFGGKCREAMNFYRDCFGGELNVVVIGESPLADQMPPESKNELAHACLQGTNFTLMGTDMNPAADGAGKNTVSISIDCADEEEITRLFNHLSAGGNVFCPVGPAFWGGIFAATTDKFGVMWMLNCTA